MMSKLLKQKLTEHKWHEFEDPVVAPDGITYERKEIEAWIARGNTTCPGSDTPLKKEDLRKNRALLSLIEAYKKGGKIELGDIKDLLDSVSFELIVDHVIAPSGHTFDRESILEVLDVDPRNPITRDPLAPDQLVPNLTLQEAVAEVKAQQVAEAALKELGKSRAEHSKGKRALRHEWADPTPPAALITPEEKKFAEKWVAQAKRDAKKQTDPFKEGLLLDLAQSVENLVEAYSDPDRAKASIRTAEERVGHFISVINRMEGTFEHVEKEKYSVKKILLAIATMGISAAIIGVKKHIKKTGAEITSELNAGPRPTPH